MPRPIKNLTDMEIDEISTGGQGCEPALDDSSSQRGLPRRKRCPSFTTRKVQPLDENALEIGDIVYDDEGNAYEFVEDDDEEEQELKSQPTVGKSRVLRAARHQDRQLHRSR